MRYCFFLARCLCCFCIVFISNVGFAQTDVSRSFKASAAKILRKEILREADSDLYLKPITITAYKAKRSEGGRHEFYSEGDYWWPNPTDTSGPYIRKDGETNPNNFVAHRLALIRFSRVIGALASAYKITGNKKYLVQAEKQLNAWFIDKDSKMNPNLQFAQAIKGLYTGRSIGVIDGVHLMEVAQGTLVMEKDMNSVLVKGVKDWFAQYIHWLMTSKYGKDEMKEKNNHGTCYVMQLACFAKLTGNKAVLDFCSNRFKTVLLPNQMAENGSFPLELARTKPYSYSIFNLDAMVTICQIISTKKNDLWDYQSTDGKNIKKGIEYLYPFIADKSKWTLKPDVMFWKQWPVAQPALLFGAIHFDKANWFDTWANLNHRPKNEEVIRNLPVKYPLIWIQ